MSKWPELDEFLGALLLSDSDSRLIPEHPSHKDLDAYRNGELLPDAMEGILGHLVECVGCLNLLLDFESPTAAGASSAEVSEDSDSWQRNLVERVHRAPSKEFISRYEQLAAMRDSEKLSEAEARELLGLSDQLERMAVERLEALAELARLRGVPLRLLAREMGIKPVVNA